MVSLLRALLDGLLLRCPRCHQGRMFTGFTMRRNCPQCELQFEGSSGEITGGMAVNTVLMCLALVVAGFVLGLDPSIPLVPLLAGLVLFAIVFPIGFYRSSRGIWASILYLIGANAEPD